MEGNNEEIFGGGQVEGEGRDENSLSTLGFSIGDLPRGATPMKNIPLSALPNFHGLSSEDPDEFLFEFDILCRSYDYVTNAQKLKLFSKNTKRKCTKMVYESGRSCNHNMGTNEGEVFDQISRLLLDERKKGGTENSETRHAQHLAWPASRDQGRVMAAPKATWG